MDEDNWEIKDEIPPTEEEEAPAKPTPKEPTQNDYMAGAILANGIIWLWMQSLNIFSGFTSKISPAILADFSYVTFIVAGFISSQQVAKRSEKNQLVVALKASFYSWLGSLLMMLTMSGNPTFAFAATLFICLMAGAVVGTYMLIKERINLRRRLIEASS